MAIVDYSDRLSSTILEMNCDRVRSSIKGILNEFFHNGGGTFDDFAGCYLSNDRGGEWQDRCARLFHGVISFFHVASILSASSGVSVSIESV